MSLPAEAGQPFPPRCDRQVTGVSSTAPRFNEAPFVKRLFESHTDGVLAMDGQGYRLYSNPSLDAMVAGDGRLPLHTSNPPPYVPTDQHPAYHRLLEAVPRVLANTGSASGRLVLAPTGRGRIQVDVTVGALAPPRGSFLAIWLVRNGGRVVDRPVTDALSTPDSMGWRRPIHPPGLGQLTPREIEVLDLLLDGWRVQSIATGLFVSEHTVRNHLKAVFRKLDAHSQRELIEKLRSWRAER